MNKILTLNPTANNLSYAVFSTDTNRITSNEIIENFRTRHNVGADDIENVLGIFKKLKNAYELDAIAIRVTYGGEKFKNPVVLDEDVKNKLESLIPEAPLHIPFIISLIDELLNTFIAPIFLFFETSFFVELPEKEQLYAIDTDEMNSSKIRKYGYHGLYHRHGCKEIYQTGRTTDETQDNIISICLEPRPEVAGIKGEEPVFVTSGTTPMEGLIGDRFCGDIDPKLIIEILENEEWGTEKIETILTQKSGLTAMIDHETTLEEVFTVEENEKSKFAQRIVIYEILKSIGSCLAVLNGLDHIIFSGRYETIGNYIFPEIIDKVKNVTSDIEINPFYLNHTVKEIISEETISLLK